MSQQEESRRVRAWVMAKADDPAKAADDLMKHPLADNYVLIRADEVEGADMNLIVPVVETNRQGLRDALTTIRKDTGDQNPAVAKVRMHRPAHGTGNDEPNDGHVHGRNAWG